MLMKAKINFTATIVGKHPNVVKFIGAVIDDPASKAIVFGNVLKSICNGVSIEKLYTLRYFIGGDTFFFLN